MSLDIPTMATANLVANTYGLNGQGGGLDLQWQGQQRSYLNDLESYTRGLGMPPQRPVFGQEEDDIVIKADEKFALRVVQVFVADPDPLLPVEHRLLYSGEVKTTDATDEELFYETDIKAKLDAHNDVRKKTRDKSIKDKEEFLEPIRIRDLVMTVVTLASFAERKPA